MLAWATFFILTFYGTLIMFVALPPNPKLKKKYLSENVTLPEWNFWATSVHAEKKKKNTRCSGENTALPHLGESCSVMSDSATSWTTQSTEFSRPEYWSGYLFPPPGDLPNPGIEPRSPTLWVDSLPAEPQGKPKNTRVGSLSLFQRIFLTQGIELGSP